MTSHDLDVLEDELTEALEELCNEHEPKMSSGMVRRMVDIVKELRLRRRVMHEESLGRFGQKNAPAV